MSAMFSPTSTIFWGYGSCLVGGAITYSFSSLFISFIIIFYSPFGLLGLMCCGRKSNIKGISIYVSFVNVKLALPTIALMTRTPISIYYLEINILGSITLMGVCKVLGIPHLGCINISPLYSPTAFDVNLTLNFFTSSAISLTFSVIYNTLPLMCSTIGYLDVFFIYSTSYNLWPTHKVVLVVERGFTVNLGSWSVHEHTIAA